jgi:hypothetical protein
MKSKGIKYDNEKLMWYLLPFNVIEHIVKVLHKGALKYAPSNYHLVKPYRIRYFSALMRHLTSRFFHGEIYDKDTGELHLAHAGCCLLFLLEKDIKDIKHNKELIDFEYGEKDEEEYWNELKNLWRNKHAKQQILSQGAK